MWSDILSKPDLVISWCWNVTLPSRRAASPLSWWLMTPHTARVCLLLTTLHSSVGRTHFSVCWALNSEDTLTSWWSTAQQKIGRESKDYIKITFLSQQKAEYSFMSLFKQICWEIVGRFGEKLEKICLNHIHVIFPQFHSSSPFLIWAMFTHAAVTVKN